MVKKKESFLRRHRAFLVASLSTWVFVGLAWLGYQTLGRSAITARHEAEGAGIVRRLLAHFDDVARASLAGTGALYVLVLLVYALVRGRHWKLALPAVLVWWLGVETWIAPYFVQVLRLEDYYYVTDPDHWPDHRDEKQGMNTDLIRCPWEPYEFTEEGFNVIFLGDSFTWGAKIEDSTKVFASLVGEKLRAAYPDRDVKWANFGWWSSSPLLSYRRLSHLGHKYHPDVVALFVDMTDFQDDIRYRNYFARKGVYGWIARLPLTMYVLKLLAPETLEAWRDRSTPNMPKKRFFVTEAPLEETRPYFEPIMQSIEDIDTYCREQGWLFLLYILPRSYQCSDRECPHNWEADEYTILGPYVFEPFRYFKEDVQPTAKYPIYSLLQTFRKTDVFPTCFDDDPHWTEAGHAVAAEYIFETMKKEIDERR